MKYTLEKLQKMMKKTGGSLYLRGTNITALPDNLTVGGSLYLSGTNITALPDNLTVGGSLDLSGTNIKKNTAKRLKNGDYVEGKYLYADNILTHIKRKRRMKGYTYYIGKIEGKNVIYDGKNYAHCKTFKDGVIDLQFKQAKERGAEQYKNLTIESVINKDDAITMYRIITGACRQGTENFLNSLKETKEEYTVKEIIDITDNQYGSETFKRFFYK